VTRWSVRARRRSTSTSFEPAAIRRAVDGHDAVVNLATHMPSSTMRMLLKWSWRENDHLRREGSAALVEASMVAGVRRFIQESFAPTYADGGDRWIDERWQLRPVAYNRTVLDASHDDAAAAVVASLGVPSGAYNVTDDEPLRRDEWIASLADAVGLPRPKPLPEWLGQFRGSIMELLSRSLRMSNAKFRAASDWAPAWPSVREGWRALAPELREKRAA
jgi:hypothetical protein